jgi:hypothetical protein
MPGPLRDLGQSPDAATSFVHSREARAAENTAVDTVVQMTYDAFIRKYVYEPAAKAISQQAQTLVTDGYLGRAKAAEWVNSERNALLINIRDERSSPLGRAISEYLKPRDKLPGVDTLVQKYSAKMPGATEDEVFVAIVRSGARTRQSVNRLAVALRWGGPVLLAVNIGFSAYLIREAPPDQRARVAAREIGGMAGGMVGGWAGAKGGCLAGSAIGVWFEGVGAVPGCAAGAIIGALGVGWAGSELGSYAGEATYDFSQTVVDWVEDDASASETSRPITGF